METIRFRNMATCAIIQIRIDVSYLALKAISKIVDNFNLPRIYDGALI